MRSLRRTPAPAPSHRRRSRRSLRLVVALAATAALALPSAATARGPQPASTGTVKTTTHTYVVLLASPPLATYDGDVPGLARTAPRPGHRFRADRPAVASYHSYLLGEQEQVLGDLGSPPVLYHYTTALNGFAAELTDDQAAALSNHTDVLAVERSRVEHVAGSRSRDRLGLAGTDGVWQSVGGPGDAGSGTVIGVIDSGIWPENPSFAAVPLDAATTRATYPGFTGTCGPGERWSPSLCNAKVIAARSFLRGFGADNLSSAEFESPRDGSGHGSHTAAIAAGNAGVDVSVDHQHFGHVSGVAPGAALAVYKACWAAPDPGNDGCATPDTAKAIDQAVHDGVDVLNYSVSGHDTQLTDVIELAFLNAAAAGVFVSAAAGDDGPGSGTVSHSGPWVTTVAASRTDSFQGAVTLGNGKTLSGAMVSNQGVGERPLVAARNVPAHGVAPWRAEHCFPGSLAARRVEGAVVVCARGLNGRVTKSRAVGQAGGAAMVLVNRTRGGTDADLHAVPTVHVTKSEGRQILAYLGAAKHPTASLDAESGRRLPPAMADFSARGPSPVSADVLKPDLTAPGVSVLAAVAPPSNFGHLWDLYSGTSMAAPQVAGLAAIISGRHPQWTPAMTKSALMTTARPVGDIALPLQQGAGEVGPRAMLDPGLVYGAGYDDWLAYLRGSGDSAAAPFVDGTTAGIRPVDLNMASIAVGSLVGEESVTRTVTNVGGSTESYTARVTGLRGIAASVSTPSITLRPGGSATFDVTLTARGNARYGRFAQGELTWQGSAGHVVSSPVVVRPELVDAPAELTATDLTGSLGLTAQAGVTGTIDVASSGVVGAAPHGFVLKTGAFDPMTPRADASTSRFDYRVPVGTTTARFDARTASPGDDLDLYVYRHGSLVVAAETPGRDELVTLDDPRPGHYEVYVHAASALGEVTLGSLTGWLLRGANNHAVGDEVSESLQVAPSPVTVTGGRPFGLTLSWQRLDGARRWLGVVGYDDSDRRTFLTVN